ncbi:hypothetical protein AAHA92_00014 [Salvia divinorum]|uniref:Uncharacterized protein n=1 Tax=Salvia divinorum TaxID=28513 RepID=A0ABD1IKY7_SALDI
MQSSAKLARFETTMAANGLDMAKVLKVSWAKTSEGYMTQRLHGNQISHFLDYLQTTFPQPPTLLLDLYAFQKTQRPHRERNPEKKKKENRKKIDYRGLARCTFGFSILVTA